MNYCFIIMIFFISPGWGFPNYVRKGVSAGAEGMDFYEVLQNLIFRFLPAFCAWCGGGLAYLMVKTGEVTQQG